jgi:hypothetical protein
VIFLDGSVDWQVINVNFRKEFIKRSAGDEAIQSRRKAVGSAAPKKDEQ